MTGLENSASTKSSQKLRVLAVHRYYWPDTPPYASLLRRIVRQWGEDGHDVEVVAGQPSYKAALDNRRRPRVEVVDLSTVRRLALPVEVGRPLVRLLNGLVLSLYVAWRLLIGRFDVVMISTIPPVLGAWVVSRAALLTRTRFIYHCMDIQPEVGAISGEFRGRLIFKLLTHMDSASCRAAAPVVVLADDMRDCLRSRRGGDRFQIFVQNNFSVPTEYGDADDAPFEMPAPFTLLFAGNLGRFQGLDVLVLAMARLSDRRDICLVVMGEGRERHRLEEIARDSGANVRFVGHHSVAAAKGAMSRASAAFIGLVPGMFRFAYPSKTMTYLEQGCPLIVAVEPQSSLAADVVNFGLGVVVAPGAVAELAEAIRHLSDNPATLRAMRRNASVYGRARFSETDALPRWSQLLSTRETRND